VYLISNQPNNKPQNFLYISQKNSDDLFFNSLPTDKDLVIIEINKDSNIVVNKKDEDKVRELIEDHQDDFALIYNQRWTGFMRDKESEIIAQNILKYAPNQKNITILEVGGGNGYMASVIDRDDRIKANLKATDIAPRYPSFFPVTEAKDGLQPLDNKSCDVIYSSNVLEHVTDIPNFMNELNRVLKDDGVMIHTMPSSQIALITWLVSPVAYFRNFILFFKRHKSRFMRYSFYWWGDKAKSFLKVTNPLRAILPPRHGEFSGFETLTCWTAKSWTRRLTHSASVEVIEVDKLRLTASMHKLLPWKLMGLRRLMAKLGCSTVNVYILKKTK